MKAIINELELSCLEKSLRFYALWRVNSFINLKSKENCICLLNHY